MAILAPNTSTRAAEPGENTQLSAGTLGVGSIVFMVIAAAAPLTNIGAVVPLGIISGNGAGFPAMYAISALILLVFSVGLTTMAQRISEPGAFFSYVEASMGRRLGMSTAYLAILTYTAVQYAVYTYLGSQLSHLASMIGIDLPWWVFTVLMVAVVGTLGYRHIELSSKALGVALIGEIGITLVIVAGIVLKGGAEGLSMTSFEPSTILSGTPGVGLMLAFACFIGFESTTVFRSEAKDADTTIPRATFVAVSVIGVFYTLSAWAIVEAWGPNHVAEVAAADPEAMVITTAVDYAGPWAGVVVQILLLTSLFAAALSFHNVISRYQHAVARKGCLPGPIALIHYRHHSPHNSSLLQSATVVVLTLACAVLGFDPVLELFTWGAGLATFTMVWLMIVVDVAILLYFRTHPAGKDSAFKRIYAPLLALGGLGIAGFFITTNLVSLVGGSITVAWVLGLSAPVVFLAGWLVAKFTEEPA
ncbi:APC family permease [Corynebacterium vitaeruminis]|uniref:APC family permease n=1 Tax=Corynebacterium vitaeruminis TaxID=38305 RepID=UPI0012DD6557|nr:APC family permease [Corynebacterium vitaeruminis]